jgi:hypothetical protein
MKHKQLKIYVFLYLETSVNENRIFPKFQGLKLDFWGVNKIHGWKEKSSWVRIH